LREPQGQVAITSLAQSNPHQRRKVRRVRLLGHRGSIAFRQTGQALVIDLPATLPTRHGSAFAIDFA